jgi:hypothetical protein
MESKRFTQTGTFSIAVMLPIFIFSAFKIISSRFNDPAVSGLFIFLAITFLLCLLIFYKLTITVDDNNVSFSLGVGIIRKTYPLANIAECIPVKNSVFTGIGIRMLTNGWLYNVSGMMAVELRFKNRKSVVRIGTDRPEEVAEAINLRLNTSIQPSSVSKEAGNGWYLALAVIFFVLFLPAILMMTGSKQAAISEKTDGFRIEGMYGLTIGYSDIVKADTVNAMPSIRIRTNGFASGSILKGNFQLSDRSKVKLFVNRKRPPFIRLQTHEKVIYINRDSHTETISLFKLIKSHMPE